MMLIIWRSLENSSNILLTSKDASIEAFFPAKVGFSISQRVPWSAKECRFYQGSQPKLFFNGIGYCWWKKSCTSWYGKNPIICRVLYIPGGCLGFRPSTVSLDYDSNLGFNRQKNGMALLSTFWVLFFWWSLVTVVTTSVVDSTIALQIRLLSRPASRPSSVGETWKIHRRIFDVNLGFFNVLKGYPPGN